MMAGFESYFVATDSRLGAIPMGQRDALRSIAARARRIYQGEDHPDRARLYQDVITILHIIGGEFSQGQEPLL